MSDVTIRRVEATDHGDIQTAVEIWVEAAEWLNSIGLPLWDPAQFTIERASQQAARGELYLAIAADRAVGAFLLQDEDERFWPEIPAGESLFLHRLAVRRSVAGQGVARQMLVRAEEEAGRRERIYLRLDCASDRPRLREFYLRAGFTFRDIRNMGKYTVARLEKPVLSTGFIDGVVPRPAVPDGSFPKGEHPSG